MLAFFVHLGQNPKARRLHVSDCRDRDDCDCPKLPAYNTILSYKSALRTGFNNRQHAASLKNPMDSFEVTSFLKRVKKLTSVNRLEDKQALPIPVATVMNVTGKMDLDAAFNRNPMQKNSLRRDACLFRLLSFIGGRSTDILSLKWGDISFSEDVLNCTISIKCGKTATIRKPWVIHTHAEDRHRIIASLITLSRSYATKPDNSEFLFRSVKYDAKSNPLPLKIGYLNKIITKWFGKEYSSHSFRVAKAIGLKQAGATLERVALGIGATCETAARYSRKTDQYATLMY